MANMQMNKTAMPEQDPILRGKNFQEVALGYTQEQAANEAASPAENTVTLPQISIDDFAKIELRVARVTACEPIPRAKKLLRLTLDDGSGTPRTVASGIAQWYTPQDLTGHNIIVVANLKPAVLCGVESQGMILAADLPNGSARVLFADDCPPGAKIR